MHALYAQLCRFSPEDWTEALDALRSSIHEIDRNATTIWFAFFPLKLHQALESAADPVELSRRLGLMGRWRLADQVDESHRFLYAHRYWPRVRSAISAERTWPAGLPAIATALADDVARTARVDRELVLGISAVGLMTLRQAGPEAFAAAPGTIHLSEQAQRMTPRQVLKKRAKDDWQGPLGITRGVNKQWTVTFDESDPAAAFPLINNQEIASAAQSDKRDYRSRDARCTIGEGPIPVECRAASCGTCWIGVLAGAEKLSPVVERDERARMKVFGYLDSPQPQPIIRLACQARARGAVSIVIPPWNGMFGVYLQRQNGEGRKPDGKKEKV